MTTLVVTFPTPELALDFAFEVSEDTGILGITDTYTVLKFPDTVSVGSLTPDGEEAVRFLAHGIGLAMIRPSETDRHPAARHAVAYRLAK